jgi:hypothetical protein
MGGVLRFAAASAGFFFNAPAIRCWAHLFVLIAGCNCDQLCVGWIFILSQSDERPER